jgi:hypothetical protein
VVFRPDIGLILPGLLGGVGLEIDMDPIVCPVRGTLLQDHRQEEEGNGVVAGHQESGLRDSTLVVVLRGFDRVVHQLLPGRRVIRHPGLLEEGWIDQHGAVLEVVLLRHAEILTIHAVGADRRFEEAIRHPLGEIGWYRIEQAESGILRDPCAEHLLDVGHGAGVVASLQFADEDLVREVLVDDVDVRVFGLEAVDHLDVGGDEGRVIV